MYLLSLKYETNIFSKASEIFLLLLLINNGMSYRHIECANLRYVDAGLLCVFRTKFSIPKHNIMPLHVSSVRKVMIKSFPVLPKTYKSSRKDLIDKGIPDYVSTLFRYHSALSQYVTFILRQ
ncbi:hypothetical protein CEXT_399691 [Caerostris extrusa]|uniref:Uncharacterized protein n=1 Tax=Caerostris extrusa TaxID=172846 RepID=A0AAV4SNM1_CAEEX|nr:hypothetical protein CEXT_399691 [Caerostris extrusa]